MFHVPSRIAYLPEKLHTSPDGEGRTASSAGDQVPNAGCHWNWKEEPARHRWRGRRGKRCGGGQWGPVRAAPASGAGGETEGGRRRVEGRQKSGRHFEGERARLVGGWKEERILCTNHAKCYPLFMRLET